jgi:hypothetical protein
VTSTGAQRTPKVQAISPSLEGRLAGQLTPRVY